MDFPKNARVRKRREYLQFFNQSEVKRLGSCLLFRIANDQNQARLGITVKSRTNSVFRNKIKRQIRESFRAHRQRMGAFDYNIVVPSQVKVTYLTAEKVRMNLEGLWGSNEIRF
jgi:ribonuclease P protein component